MNLQSRTSSTKSLKRVEEFLPTSTYDLDSLQHHHPFPCCPHMYLFIASCNSLFARLRPVLRELLSGTADIGLHLRVTDWISFEAVLGVRILQHYGFEDFD